MDNIEFDLKIEKDWWIKYGLIKIPKQYRDLFPPAGEKVIIVYDDKKIETHMHRGGNNRIDGLKRFYKSHPEVNVGSIIKVTKVKDYVFRLTPLQDKERNVTFETIKQKMSLQHTNKAVEKIPIKFIHTITPSEVKTYYINLNDDEGKSYGKYFPLHGTKLTIIDDQNRTFSATKHHETQIWGSIYEWFKENEIRPGTRVLISYNPNEKDGNGRPVIRLFKYEQAQQSVITHEKVTRASTEIPLEFEKHLEDFIEKNLNLIQRGLTLYIDDNGNRGRQYPTDVGIIDLLCRDEKGNFVIIELKKDRQSDIVVGQISRYMGWVKKHLAGEKDVYGIIITHEYDKKLKYAVLANDKLKLMYYKITMSFVPEEEIETSEKD